MNIYDISEKAGVSIATVSRVINGSENVSEKTRQKVIAVMKENKYTPNAFARGLMLNTMHTIGIMCSDSSDAYLANAVYHLEKELRSNGYDSILCCTGYELENKQKYLKLLSSKRVDALILAGSSFLDLKSSNNAYIVKAAKQVPVMLMNACLNKPGIYNIVCDDCKAVEEAAEYLIEDGRERILFLYQARSYSAKEKQEGYRNALKKHHLPVDKALIRQCPKTKQLDQVEAFLEEISQEGVQFDAVLASEDFWAVGAVKYARHRGLSIPEDISIIGFNNSQLAQCCEPELTTIDNKVELLCKTTVHLLMQVLEGQEIPQSTTLQAELVKRKTTSIT
ncbi:MAG: LacI family transcriptional regulator [Lachnospiraceae bacterium]|nr:LacI family transcriptional regulator [Lachnospiraceae bacterium]